MNILNALYAIDNKIKFLESVEVFSTKRGKSRALYIFWKYISVLLIGLSAKMITSYFHLRLDASLSTASLPVEVVFFYIYSFLVISIYVACFWWLIKNAFKFVTALISLGVQKILHFLGEKGRITIDRDALEGRAR